MSICSFCENIPVCLMQALILNNTLIVQVSIQTPTRFTYIYMQCTDILPALLDPDKIPLFTTSYQPILYISKQMAILYSGQSMARNLYYIRPALAFNINFTPIQYVFMRELYHGFLSHGDIHKLGPTMPLISSVNFMPKFIIRIWQHQLSLAFLFLEVFVILVSGRVIYYLCQRSVMMT